jgi:type I restriction enzyme S subunit
VLSELTGTTSHHVNIRHIRNVKINVPPLLEQRRIVAHLDALQSKLDALRRHQTQTAAELDALLPAVQDPGIQGRALNRPNSTELPIKY